MSAPAMTPPAHPLRPSAPDAVVVGSGPERARGGYRPRAGRGGSVRVLEEQATLGGGARSGELTLPGFVHDLGSGHSSARRRVTFLPHPAPGTARAGMGPAGGSRWPTLSTTGRRAALLPRRWTGPAPGLGADGDAYGRLMAPFRAPVRGPGGRVPPAHVAPSPGIPSCWPPSTWPPSSRRPAWPGVCSGGEHARGLLSGLAGALLPAVGSPPSRPVSRWCWGAAGPRGRLAAAPGRRAENQRRAGGRAARTRRQRSKTHRRVDSLRDAPSARAVLLGP